MRPQRGAAPCGGRCVLKNHCYSGQPRRFFCEGNAMETSAHRAIAIHNTRICVGIGGWTFEPWRGSFYPAGLAHSKELQYASRQLTAIEVNGTYYSTFKPPTFAK